jgi:hypothetical protein
MSFSSPEARGEALTLTPFLLLPIIGKRRDAIHASAAWRSSRTLTLLTVGCGSAHRQASILFPTLHSPYTTTHVVGNVFPT